MLSEKAKLAKVDRNRRRRAGRKKLGLCTECDTKAVIGKNRCDYHISLDRESKLKLRASRKAQGLCKDCGEKAVNKIYCDKHRILYNKVLLPHVKAQKKNWRLSGKCLNCGILLNPEMDNNYVVCLNCRIEKHLPFKRSDFKF